MATEIELKYLLLPAETAATEINIAEQITKVLTKDNYVFKIEQKKLSNYYLDTADLALRQLDMGLRVRGIQHDGQTIRYEQTIKTSGEVIGGLHKRPEYNVDIDDEQVKLALFPSNIWHDSSTNIVNLQQAIVRLFNTHFERITWTISIGDSVIELAFDQGTISCDNFDETDIKVHLKNFGVSCSDIEMNYGSNGYGPSVYIYDPDGNKVELKGVVNSS